MRVFLNVVYAMVSENADRDELEAWLTEDDDRALMKALS